METKLKQVIEYFENNWHEIREQWVEGFKWESCNYLDSTNNRLKSINQNIKSVVTRHSSLLTFFEDLMKCLNFLSVERDQRAAMAFERCAVIPVCPGTSNFWCHTLFHLCLNCPTMELPCRHIFALRRHPNWAFLNQSYVLWDGLVIITETVIVFFHLIWPVLQIQHFCLECTANSRSLVTASKIQKI